MLRKLALLLLLLQLHNSSSAQTYHFTFDKECAEAYRLILSLQTKEGNSKLNEIARKDPKNYIPYFLADYSDCIEILFNGDPRLLQRTRSRVESRLALLESTDKKNPWHRYVAANIFFHEALIYMRFGDNFKAATKLRKSFILLKENLQQFPAFEENKVLFGLQTAAAGAIPDSHKWLAQLMGIKGEIRKGVSMLSNYRAAHSSGDSMLYREAFIFEHYLRFYLMGEPEAAFNSLLQKTEKEPQNRMYSFLRANLALNYRRAAIAKPILSSLENSGAFEQFPIFAYEQAEALAMELNPRCSEAYLKFLKTYKGSAFVKDSYLKLAWMQRMQGNHKEATAFLNLLQQTGNTLTDADKQAQRFAEKPIWPLNSLLAIRLLIDGGYYKQALEKIQSIKPETLTQQGDKIEYYFRYGRIMEELEEKEKALECYKQCIAIGKDERLYYAARAALQQGFIYERSGKKAEAKERFQYCLSLRNHDLQSSIDQLAKAGINRLEH